MSNWKHISAWTIFLLLTSQMQKISLESLQGLQKCLGNCWPNNTKKYWITSQTEGWKHMEQLSATVLAWLWKMQPDGYSDVWMDLFRIAYSDTELHQKYIIWCCKNVIITHSFALSATPVLIVVPLCVTRCHDLSCWSSTSETGHQSWKILSLFCMDSI